MARVMMQRPPWSRPRFGKFCHSGASLRVALVVALAAAVLLAEAVLVWAVVETFASVVRAYLTLLLDLYATG